MSLNERAYPGQLKCGQRIRVRHADTARVLQLTADPEVFTVGGSAQEAYRIIAADLTTDPHRAGQKVVFTVLPDQALTLWIG